MADFQIRGVEDFTRVAKALEKAGRGDLSKDLTRGLEKAVKSLTPKTQAEARKILPSAGGLAEKVATTPQRLQRTSRGGASGVRLAVSRRRGSGASAANRGQVKHPVFGNRSTWVSQQVPPGWFDNTIEREGPAVLEALRPVIAAMLERVAKEG